MRNSFLRRMRDTETSLPARRETTHTPGWVKGAVVIIILLILFVVILHLTGHGFGPHMHLSIITTRRLLL